MKAHLAYIKNNLALTTRDRTVLFFNYVFPLIFFFMFGQMMGASKGSAALMVVNMVMVIGVIGSGLFGAGMRATMDRDMNILRRFKVAPITPSPIIWAGLIGGLVHYVPVMILIFALAHFVYKMPWPDNWVGIFGFVCLGVLAFRGIGGIVAAVVNSMAESQIVTQVLYFPMLFLSGATIPLSIMPDWLQTVAQFFPSTHLYTGLQSMLVQKQGFMSSLKEAGALGLTTAVCFFISFKLFRWEKEEVVSNRSKLWILGVLAPFVFLGVFQAYSKENLKNSKIVERELSRGRTRLVRNVRIVVGDGEVIESGAVLLKNGKIAETYKGTSPEAKELDADEVEGAGKTLLPGLIDMHLHLSAPGGMMDFSNPDNYKDMDIAKGMERATLAYLYSGVTTIRSVGDGLDTLTRTAESISRGEKSGSELMFCGPMFTASDGHGTEYFKHMPAVARAQAEEQTVRTPKSADEARKQVADLKGRVHCIKAILESGWKETTFNRLDGEVYKAIAAAARENNLPLATHTSDLRDVTEAVEAGTSSIEHGGTRELIPDEVFAKMKAKGIAYTPTLAVMESIRSLAQGKTEVFERSLVEQVGPTSLLASSKAFVKSGKLGADWAKAAEALTKGYEIATSNTLRAHKAGVLIITGTDAGNPGVIHGPGVHRELQLLVEAGLPNGAALQAATGNAAKVLGIDGRTGFIRKGYEGTLVLVDGNPLQDITATERISAVFNKGERVSRNSLFDDYKKEQSKKGK